MKTRLLSAADIVRALPMGEVIEAMKSAYAQLSKGQVDMPLRSHISLAAVEGVTLVMPAHLQQEGDLAVKVVSVFPHNARQGLPTIHAMVLVLEASTGRPLALMEGGSLTAIRTGAGAGAATDILARADARVLAILGSGVQARTQLEAMCTVRPIEEVRVFSPNPSHAERFVREMAGRTPIPDAVYAAGDPDEAIARADIICAATTSTTPVFNGSVVEPGTHINGVGSFRPDMQEFDLETIRRARVYVDSREAVMAEAGELIIPIRSGAIDESHIVGEIGAVINGDKPGRVAAADITFFKSVGVAVQDAAAGSLALRNAEARQLGRVFEF